MRLDGKVILVTGSATGIGRAIATRCVAEGARVVVHGLEADLVAEVVADLGDDRAVGHVEELAATGCPARLVGLAVSRFGRLDSLVNNAAIVATGNVHTTDEAGFLRIVTVNTLVPLLLVQAALPHLRKARGCVLNIGSVNAHGGEPDLLAYSISKGGLMTLTRNLGDVLMREEGVRVNQINPGWVLTENEALRKREQGLPDGWTARLPRETSPTGRLLAPAEMASAAVFWLSDESGPVSGQVVDLEQYPALGRNLPKTLVERPPERP